MADNNEERFGVGSKLIDNAIVSAYELPLSLQWNQRQIVLRL
jgi:hypothetical protein